MKECTLRNIEEGKSGSKEGVCVDLQHVGEIVPQVHADEHEPTEALMN